MGSDKLGIFRRISAALFPNRKPVEKSIVVSPALTSAFFSAPRFALGEDISSTKPYANHNWVYAAISSKAQALSQIPFVIYQAPGSGTVTSYRAQLRQILHGEDPRKKAVPESSEYEVVESGEFYDLFQSPNPMMCRYDLWQSWMISMDLWGEAFWVLEPKGDQRLAENEIPAEIWPQNPATFEPIIDKDSKTIAAWKQTIDGKMMNWMPHEVIQFKRWNPYNPIRGLSPMCAAASAIRQDSKADEFNEGFLRNGAYPSGSLSTEKEIDEAQRNQLRMQFEDRHAGSSKAGRVLLLEKGLKFEAASISHKDMDFLEQRKWNREQILSVFKVPKIVVGVYEDINYATSQTAYRLFYQNAIIPDAKYIEDILLSRFFNPMTQEKEFGAFDLSGVEALRDDLSAKATTAFQFWQMGVPFNEINEKLSIGFDPIDGGETGWISSGLQPTLFADEEFFEDPQQEEEQPNQNSADQDDVSRKWLEEKARTKNGRAHAQIESAVIRPSEKEYLSKFRRYLYDLRSDQLRILENAPVPRANIPLDETTLEAMLFSRARWDAQLEKRMKSSYESAMKRSAKQVAIELGKELVFDLQDPRVVEWFQNKFARLVQVNRTIQDSLRNLIIEKMSDGTTVTDLQAAIRERFNELSAGRALTIARTESATATSFARNKTYEDEGVEYLEWSAMLDDATRQSHRDQDGVVVKAGEPFPNGLRYPNEPGAPAGETINCRCVVLAVEGPKED